MLDSIRAMDIVRYIVGVRSWEGPLWKDPMYNQMTHCITGKPAAQLRSGYDVTQYYKE